MCVKPAQCLQIVRTQKWKTRTRNFQKYFYNNQDNKEIFFEDTVL